MAVAAQHLVPCSSSARRASIGDIEDERSAAALALEQVTQRARAATTAVGSSGTVPTISVEHTSDDGETSGASRIGINDASASADDESRLTASERVAYDILRRKLKFFFMNPVEKFSARRQFPWKLFFQVIKIILVTAQLFVFGTIRTSHIQYLRSSTITFRHLLLQNWDAVRDIEVYPPSTGPYAAFNVADFYTKMSYVAVQYYHLNESTIGSYDFFYEKLTDPVPPPLLVLSQFRRGQTWPLNETYDYDTRIVIAKYNISLTRDDYAPGSNFSIQAYLQKTYNVSIDFDSLKSAQMSFKLKTISLKELMPFDKPDCFAFDISVMFDNSAFSGNVPIDLSVEVGYEKVCNGKVDFQNDSKFKTTVLIILDICVILVGVLSFLLCARAMVRARKLQKTTRDFFAFVLKKPLTLTDQLEFVNLWYVLIIINDLCIVLGTCFKLSLEYKVFDSSLFAASGMLLGMGVLFVWAGLLRYLGFFSQYNVLILTMKKSFPNVMRFMFCAGLLYFGFMFCGWVVLGPYHFKFQDLITTSECLFALINGDDMFATFNTVPKQSAVVYWFAKVYLYCFVTLFIYVVLSLFISIIMDAYEVIKERYDATSEARKSPLWEFIATCQDAPTSGTFRHLSESVDDCGIAWSAIRDRCVRSCRKLVCCCERGMRGSESDSYENLHNNASVNT